MRGFGRCLVSQKIQRERRKGKEKKNKIKVRCNILIGTKRESGVVAAFCRGGRWLIFIKLIGASQTEEYGETTRRLGLSW